MISLPIDQLPLATTGFEYAMQQPMFPGKLLLWALFMLSLLSWGVIVSKGISLFRMKQADEEFVRLYRGGRQPMQLFERNFEDRNSLRWVIYDHGAREAAFQMLGSPERDATFSVRLKTTEGLTDKQMVAVREGLSRGELAAASRLRDGMPLLSVTSLGAPFVGLLGMAWILMKTFSMNGVNGTLAEVSPGVSGALAMLVGGLIVGTPALIGQIVLGSLCRERMRVLGDFSSQYGRALEYAYASGHEMPATDADEMEDEELGAVHHDQPLTAYERAKEAPEVVEAKDEETPPILEQNQEPEEEEILSVPPALPEGDLGEIDYDAIAGAVTSKQAENHADFTPQSAPSFAAAADDEEEEAEEFTGASPFVLIEDDELESSETAERPIAAFANPDDDRPPLEDGYLFNTPFGHSGGDDSDLDSDDDDAPINPIARQAARQQHAATV